VQVLHRHSCVLAFFAGHTHESAYGRDDAGLHHVVFPGVIETLPQYRSAHATVLLYGDRVVVVAGTGSSMENIEMKIGS